MNSDEAKFILRAYRPGGHDATDPEFAEALALAERDPVLAAWLREQQAFDAAVAARIHALPPADLRSAILAGARLSQPASHKNRTMWWALAAVLVALAAVSTLFQRGEKVLPPVAPSPIAALAPWQEHALTVLGEIQAARMPLDVQKPDAAQLVAWLREQSAPTPGAIPASLAGKSAIGCKTWPWEGHRLSIVCFDLGNGHEAHIVSITADGLEGAPPLRRPVFAHKGQWQLAAWGEGEVACMLISNLDEAGVKKILTADHSPRLVLATSSSY